MDTDSLPHAGNSQAPEQRNESYHPRKVLFVFKSWPQFAFFCYLTLTLVGIVAMYLDAWGIWPAVMLLIAIGGVSHLALTWARHDDLEDYQQQMDEERGINRKKITFFIDN
ncbi:hypothetical protein ACFSJ3_05435 [Corallincola platygyrae]|uniref:2TM domain-containing protein n=1 Tax=Corallincola platygyrae TaxID=1193278 RepID=A0ABW4XIR1_9GAMM